MTGFEGRVIWPDGSVHVEEWLEVMNEDIYGSTPEEAAAWNQSWLDAIGEVRQQVEESLDADPETG